MNEQINIPDGLPSLAHGNHCASEGKACVMEYISVLAGEEFSDLPECTSRQLALAAQELNDLLRDEDRHLLVPFIGRLMAAKEDTPEIDRAFRDYIRGRRGERRVFSLAGIILRSTGCHGYHEWFACANGAPPIPRMEAHACYYDPAAGIKALDEMLTIHEQITGRTPNQPPTEALAKARAVISTGLYVPGIALVEL